MLKKKIISILALSTLIAGTVSASSMNGDFKGNPIVKVKSNGQLLSVEDTPAMIYEDRTMVPIYMLKKLGVSVDWNDSDFSVDVKIPSNSNQQQTQTKSIDVVSLANQYKNKGINFVKVSSDGSDFINLVFVSNKNWDAIIDDWDGFKQLLSASSQTISTYTSVESKDGHNFGVLTSSIRKYLNNQIDEDTFFEGAFLDNKNIGDFKNKQNQVTLNELYLYSNDGKTYLGKLTSNTYDTESIFNEFGDYGSKLSTTSIFNDFSDFGGKFSDKSAFNNLASNPPKIIDKKGNVIGYLTTNNTIDHAITPVGLKEWLKSNGY